MYDSQYQPHDMLKFRAVRAVLACMWQVYTQRHAWYCGNIDNLVMLSI